MNENAGCVHREECQASNSRQRCLPARNRSIALSIRRCRVSGVLAPFDVVNVVTLQAVGQALKESARRPARLERGVQVGRRAQPGVCP
jgi:hypothetical protein